MSGSGLRGGARMQPATARLNGSVGDSLAAALGLLFEDIVMVSIAPGPSAQCDVHRALRQLDAEAALIELGDDRALQLVALVQERYAEREADLAGEDLGVLCPGDHRARAHHGGDVA